MAKKKNNSVFALEMEKRAEIQPDFNVLTFENGGYPDEGLTYADIVTNGRKLLKLFQESGIGKGDTFCVIMRNHPEFVYSIYAGTALGAIMVPVDPRINAERLEFLIKNSKSKGIIVSREFLDNTKAPLEHLPHVKVLGVVYKDGFHLPMADEYPNINEILEGSEVSPSTMKDREGDAPVQIAYTSGTTGDPKGIVVPGTRFTAYAKIAEMAWRYGSGERLYTGLSLTHGNAQGVTLIPSLYLSIPSVISRAFTKTRLWKICRKYGITTFSLLGGMMMGIYNAPERYDDADNPVRVVISAGTPRVIWEAFEKRFNVKVHEWYGAMEGGFAHNFPGTGPLGSFGKPIEGAAKMKVVREDDTECAPKEIGELISRDLLQKTKVEYIGNREASDKKTRGGWLRSGDMCHRDEKGFFYFDYRKGGGLRKSGDFIMPEFVEAIIIKAPDVDDVCVFGIPAASGATGESDVVAAVVPTPGKRIKPETIYQMCADKLERNAIPSFLQIVDEIPKTISEKKLDRVLRNQFQKDGNNVYSLEIFNRR